MYLVTLHHCVRLHTFDLTSCSDRIYACMCVCLPLLPPLVFVHISDIMSICGLVCEPSTCVFTSDSAVCVCRYVYVYVCDSA